MQVNQEGLSRTRVGRGQRAPLLAFDGAGTKVRIQEQHSRRRNSGNIQDAAHDSAEIFAASTAD